MYANKFYSHRNHGNTFNKNVDYPLFTEYVLGRFYLYLKKMYCVCLILKTKTDLEWTDLTGISGLHRCLYFLRRFWKA